MQARASRSCRGQQERKCRSSMRYFTGQSTTLTHRAALPHLGSAAAIPCVNIRLGIRNQLIEWFRQAASRLLMRPSPATRDQIGGTQGLKLNPSDGRVAQLAEQLTLNQ